MPSTIDQELERQTRAAATEQQRVDDLQAAPTWGPEPEEPDRDKAAEAARRERMQAFGNEMSKLRSEWVRARIASGVDRRMREDADQYNGIDAAVRQASMMEIVEAGGPARQRGGTQITTRSTVFIGMTRSKTNAAEAHLADIVLPVDEKNWGLGPTPDPDLAVEAGDNSPALNEDGSRLQGPKLGVDGKPELDPQSGQPVAVPYKKSDVARAIMKLAAEAAEAMQREIDDQLTECQYLAEVRKVIHDAAVFGTGVLRGPVITSRMRRAWVVVGKDAKGGDVWALKSVAVKRPASFRRDPRYVWPDPACGDNVQNGRGVLEMEEMTPRKVKDLVKQGADPESLAKVLLEGPRRDNALSEAQPNNLDPAADQTFQVWTYTGELSLEDAEAARVPGLNLTKLSEQERTLLSISGEVLFINSTVVRTTLNPLETGDLPYDFYPWEQVVDSVFGYSMPYLLRAAQRILNSCWRQMLDNSSLTVLPQIVMRRTGILPADGQMTLYSGKIWYAADDIADVEKAFRTFDIPNHQERIEKIVRMAEELADRDTATPMLTQGERGTAPDTVGGMQLLMNSTNVVRRRQVKFFDDGVTTPHIRRYYDWNMAYNPKSDIKGDFSVDARGTSALLVRDIQNQAMMTLAQTAVSHPLFEKHTDFRKLFEKMLSAQHLKPDDVLKDKDQVEREDEASKQNPPPKDPRIEAAEIAANAQVERTNVIERTRGENSQAERDHRERMAAMEREILMLRMAHEKGLSLDGIKASLAQTAMTAQSAERRLAFEGDLRRDTGEGV